MALKLGAALGSADATPSGWCELLLRQNVDTVDGGASRAGADAQDAFDGSRKVVWDDSGVDEKRNEIGSTDERGDNEPIYRPNCDCGGIVAPLRWLGFRDGRG